MEWKIVNISWNKQKQKQKMSNWKKSVDNDYMTAIDPVLYLLYACFTATSSVIIHIWRNNAT